MRTFCVCKNGCSTLSQLGSTVPISATAKHTPSGSTQSASGLGCHRPGTTIIFAYSTTRAHCVNVLPTMSRQRSSSFCLDSFNFSSQSCCASTTNIGGSQATRVNGYSVCSFFWHLPGLVLHALWSSCTCLCRQAPPSPARWYTV